MSIHIIDFPNHSGGRILLPMTKNIYAVAGVSGHTGSVAAETLLAEGHRVRALVRDAAKGAPWQAKGAEVAIADLHDEVAVTRALSDVAGAFLLLPPVVTTPNPLADNVKLAASLARAIRAAKLPHVVLLSSIGAQHPTGTGPIQALHQAERDFAATGAAFTAVRAAYFQENWGASLGAVAQGALPMFIPADVRYAQVATADIGRTVAGALVEGGTPGKTSIIELAGPRDYTGTEVAEILSGIVGKPIVAQVGPLEAVVPTFTSFGIHAASAELYREMYAGIASGHIAFSGGSARALRGGVELGVTLRALLGK